MKKIFTLVSFCLAVMASSAQSVVDYEIRTLTFEDANYASDEPNFAGGNDWSSLIDSPQYGGKCSMAKAVLA